MAKKKKKSIVNEVSKRVCHDMLQAFNTSIRVKKSKKIYTRKGKRGKYNYD